MAEGVAGDQPAARRALQEAALDEVGLDDVFDGVARLGQGGRKRLDPDRAAAVIRRDRHEIAAVHGVEAGGVDLARSRRNSRPAMRGVPRARRAISLAPSAVTAMPSTRAPRLTIASSSGAE